MVTKTQIETIQVTQDDSLGRLLDGMKSAPVRLEWKGQRYRLVKESAVEETPAVPIKEDIWANYDPEKARAAIQQARGAFHGIDVAQLKAELREQRGQDSIGRDDLEYHVVSR